ncbi:MAG TPA: class I SAM-dependent methyltransferase [Polyangiaceae bacterium]
MVVKEHYTFGDSELAAARLRLLANVFEPGSARLLARLADPGGELALDLGCGPGYTTELVAQHVAAKAVIGLDQSPRLLDQATRERRAARLSFLRCDVSNAPFSLPPANFLYSRFLLTHLREPAQVVRAWASAAAPGAHLVLEETASMTGEHPAFPRYYALVERMQAHYGQRMYIGRELEVLCASPDWLVESADISESALPAQDMARLHLLNLQTWSSDAFARDNYGAEQISELAEELQLVASGSVAASPVALGMGQVVLRKR